MMETWLRISLLLCFFGSLKEFRPSEPFVTHYLLGEWKNFTSEQVIFLLRLCILDANCS
jgi:thiamine transporter 2/3